MPDVVALLLPTLWDRRQLELCRPRWEGRVEVCFLGPPDDEVRTDFDVVAFVREVAEAHPGLAGVSSSSDYPGAVAAALVAERLGLAGAPPRAVLSTGHKGEARRLQASVVPEAVPWFRLLEVGAAAGLPEGLRYPCFVKPVRGSFSRLARQVNDAQTLRAFLAHPGVVEHHDWYASLHRDLARVLAHVGPDPGEFLAEDLLHGRQVTAEGWIEDGRVHLLGLVDSVMHPGTHAFARFDVPSRLPTPVAERIRTLTQRVVAATGLAWSCFNAEWIWDERTDRLALIELNPRLAGQFADLWELTLGLNGYEVALAVACGRTPPAARGGTCTQASSVPLRTFVPLRVARAPDAARLAAVEAAHPGTHIWWECRAGEVLDGFDGAGEGQGYRYGVINLGGQEGDDLPARARACEAALGAELI